MSNSRIWRDQNTVPISDIIQFNANPVLPDNTGNVQQTSIQLTSAVSINTKPKGKLNELQDTGFASMTFTISGFIEDPTNSLIPQLVKEWMLDPKITVSFPAGRFGIELDDFPIYDIHPNANRGCILSDWNWVRAGETRGKAEFTCNLRFNSNLAGLNSPTYAWDVV